MFNRGLSRLHSPVRLHPSVKPSFVCRLLLFGILEKEQARTMITSALEGLKESDRTSNATDPSVDLNALSSFVER
jgi:hypothetical protein